MASRPGDSIKRVSRACDRCKVRKLKCSNTRPCERCELDQAVCHTGIRSRVDEKPVSHMLVALAEEQQAILVRAVRELWNRNATTDERSTLGTEPSVHEIVKSLGILDDPQIGNLIGNNQETPFSDSDTSDMLGQSSLSAHSDFSDPSRANIDSSIDVQLNHPQQRQLVDPFPQQPLNQSYPPSSRDMEFLATPEMPPMEPNIENPNTINTIDTTAMDMFAPSGAMDIGYPPEHFIISANMDPTTTSSIDPFLPPTTSAPDPSFQR